MTKGRLTDACSTVVGCGSTVAILAAALSGLANIAVVVAFQDVPARAVRGHTSRTQRSR